MKFIFHKVQQQTNNSDYAVYALAFASTIIFNMKLDEVSFLRPMPSHILKISSKGRPIPFPMVTYSSTVTSSSNEKQISVLKNRGGRPRELHEVSCPKNNNCINRCAKDEDKVD